MKKKRPVDYEVLKKDYMYVNAIVGITAFVTFLFMVIQRVGLFPSMPCVLHDMFHIYCPGCGGTRAIFALMHGRILVSLYYNPAVVLGILLALHYEIGVLLTLSKRNGKRYYCANWAPVIVYAVIIVLFTVLRNYLLIGHGFDMLQDFIPR